VSLQTPEKSPVGVRDSAPGWTGPDRRLHADRRSAPTQPFSRPVRQGRRRGGRRAGELENLYVDRYDRLDLGLALLLLLLNILDAVFTLETIEGDASLELNPVTRWLLEQGPIWFVASKALVVAVCLLFLTVHKTFRWVRGALHLLLALYAALFAYHLILQTRA
jgi:hypothetical protein